MLERFCLFLEDYLSIFFSLLYSHSVPWRRRRVRVPLRVRLRRPRLRRGPIQRDEARDQRHWIHQGSKSIWCPCASHSQVETVNLFFDFYYRHLGGRFQEFEVNYSICVERLEKRCLQSTRGFSRHMEYLYVQHLNDYVCEADLLYVRAKTSPPPFSVAKGYPIRTRPVFAVKASALFLPLPPRNWKPQDLRRRRRRRRKTQHSSPFLFVTWRA